MKKIFAKHAAWSVAGAVAVLALVGAAWYVASSRAPAFDAVAATRGNITESLDEAGTVAAEHNANLSFQEPGAIAHVYVTEGEAVAAGTVLADLSSASLEASVEQANAVLASAEAKLSELQSGTRSEQLAIDESAVASASSSLGVDIGNAYTTADDAIHNETDNLFNEPKSNNPIFLVPMGNSQMLNDIESSRLALEPMLSRWYASLGSTDASAANTTLNQIRSYLDLLALAVNDATPNATMTTTVLAGYKADVAAARAEVGTALTTIASAEATLAAAQNTLALAEAGSTLQDIAAQQAVVAQDKAAATAAQVALDNASLVAPFTGTVQNLTAQVGQAVSLNAPIASIVNNGGLKIQAYVSEADVAKVKIDDVAQVTLDAFGTDTKFPAKITTIDSAETQVNGTPSYLVTLHFTDPEPQIKDGMTGNVHIRLAENDDVIEVPSRLVISDGNQYFVLTATSVGTVKKSVTIGLVGDNGMTEIVTGLHEGDQLTNF